MSTTQHFLLSYTTAILGATLLSVLVFFTQDWLQARQLPAPLFTVGSFVVGFLLFHWLFRTYVPVRCPLCLRKTGYCLKHRTDRYRCCSCGADF